MAISLDADLAAADWEPWLECLLAVRIAAVQVRAKQLHDRDLFELVRRAVNLVGESCLVLVNGRFDIALAAGAHGVHLPATGLPVEPLRRRADFDHLLVGRSTHNLEEVERARLEGCDYALFGPVKNTPSKPGLATIPGFELLQKGSLLGLPLLALGGIETPDDISRAAVAGAAGIAAMRAFADPNAAARLAERARELWPSTPEVAS